jgi:hypothetical protein
MQGRMVGNPLSNLIFLYTFQERVIIVWSSINNYNYYYYSSKRRIYDEVNARITRRLVYSVYDIFEQA